MYSFIQFKRDFGEQSQCLNYIFEKKYRRECSCGGKFYQSKKRKCFTCSSCKEHIYPLKGTILEQSSTDLSLWFYALFLFANSRNGVSAMELKRQLGVTYKTAWRIANRIRKLMREDVTLNGVVEIDEAYIGGKKRGKEFRGGAGKAMLLGFAQRKDKFNKGLVSTKIIPNRETNVIVGSIKERVKRGSLLFTDEASVYKKMPRFGYGQDYVTHWSKEYVKERPGLVSKVHTNTIEGFWSQLKRSIDGTYHHVSAKHLQSYADEFAWRYNHSYSDTFQALLGCL